MYSAKPSMSVPVIAGGLFLGVLSALPPISFLNCACCILVIGGGLLASYLYMKGYPVDAPRVSYGDGALLGLLAGLVGAVVDTVVSIPINLMLNFGFSNQEALEQLRNTPEIPPELVQFLESIMAGGGHRDLLLTSVQGHHLFDLWHGRGDAGRGHIWTQRGRTTRIGPTKSRHESLPDDSTASGTSAARTSEPAGADHDGSGTSRPGWLG